MSEYTLMLEIEMEGLKSDLAEARAQIAAEKEERHKIVAALRAASLELHPIPDGEGRWHYEVRTAPARETK